MSFFTVKLLAYVSGALLLACLLLSAGWYVEDAAHDRTKSEHQAANDRAAREFADAARQVEQAHAKALAAVAEQYEQDKRDAEQKAASVAADLRSGAVRLQKRWGQCETGRLSSAAASAVELDAARRDREESAGRIVSAAAHCDAQVRRLQDALRGLSR